MKLSVKIAAVVGASAVVIASAVGIKQAIGQAYANGVIDGRVGYVATPTKEDPTVRVVDRDGQGWTYNCIEHTTQLSADAGIVENGNASSKEEYTKNALKKVFVKADPMWGEYQAERVEFASAAVCGALGVSG